MTKNIMSNAELKQIQQRFKDYITGHSEDFVNDIVSTDEALAEHRLGAYYNAYRLRLIEVLANDFSGVQQLVGEEPFEYLVLDYLEQFPSQHPSIRWAGQHMAEFLHHRESLEDKNYVVEMAQFEWQQGLCFDASDSDMPLELSAMAEIPPEHWPQMHFQFHPSVSWLDLYCNVPPYWVAVEEKQELPQKQCEEIPTRWLMWRKKLSPNWRSLDTAEAWAIEKALEGANFAELCEGLLEWYGEDQVALTAAGLLKQWMADGMVTAIRC